MLKIASGEVNFLNSFFILGYLRKGFSFHQLDNSIVLSNAVILFWMTIFPGIFLMGPSQVDGSFHSPEWHAARLASLKTSHTVTWEEFKKKQKVSCNANSYLFLLTVGVILLQCSVNAINIILCDYVLCEETYPHA